MKPKPRCDRKVNIEREEYEALMAELPSSGSRIETSLRFSGTR